jgi:serine/threonine protein kinase
MSFKAGENVGSYRIIEKLGQGGMATVFKAYHPSLDRYVAIKVLHPAFKEDPQFLERFTREARVVARLEHPNIVQVYDFAEHEGQPYLVMKYIEGETLKARLQRGPLKKKEAIRTVQAIGESLTYAHKQGVLHRDVKPSNILISEEGQIYLTDFGLARMAEAGASTLTGDMLMGTPQYISPEQARGEKDLTERTDIYSFGIVLYEIVVGRVPFSADTPFSIIHDHIYTPLPLPKEVNPKIPLAVQEVLLKALAKEPEDRFASGKDLVEAFNQSITKPATPIIVSEDLEETRSGTKPPVSQPLILGTDVESEILTGDVEGTMEKKQAPERKLPNRNWAWIATGLLMTCLALFAMLSAFNQPGVQNADENNDPATSEEGLVAEGNHTIPNEEEPTEGEDKPNPIDEAMNEVHQRPDDPEAHLKLAEAYRREGRMDDAANAFFQAGKLFEELGRVREAIKTFNDAIMAQGGIQKADQEVVEKLIEVLFISAVDQNLASMYVVTSENFPNWNILKICEARNHLFSGDVENAQVIIENVLRDNPENYLAKTVLAEIYFHNGDQQEALEIVKEVQNLPDLPEWFKGILTQLEREIR